MVMMLTMKSKFLSACRLRVDREHRAGPQLDHSIASRAENSAVHGVASTRRHNYETLLRLSCVSNNLLVSFSKPYCRPHIEILAFGLRNQFIGFLCTLGNDGF